MGMARAERNGRRLRAVRAMVVAGMVVVMMAVLTVAMLAVIVVVLAVTVAAMIVLVGAMIMIVVRTGSRRTGIAVVVRGMPCVVVPGMPPLHGPRRRGHRRGAGGCGREKRDLGRG
ncbi:hypothetical protein [Prosthecomicrobium hirschii]|uniref:hypothetical protein n=1 Tax=Prosthecodimorpha hirschii TaxID=665126 RepID=UPI002220CBCB|nr:hypothetical protein [Prosthecomicrobium hirschii]MCW1843312.1 hypothetical protein [Prosthecomicrobium hirschii]